MQKQTRRKFSPAFKDKVALEAVKNQQTFVGFPVFRPFGVRVNN
jgi:hypothetical protein